MDLKFFTFIYKFSELYINLICFFTWFSIHTYAENAIYDWIVATVAHGKPMTTKENNVDVSISAKMDENYLIYEAYIDSARNTQKCIIWTY